MTNTYDPNGRAVVIARWLLSRAMRDDPGTECMFRVKLAFAYALSGTEEYRKGLLIHEELARMDVSERMRVQNKVEHGLSLMMEPVLFRVFFAGDTEKEILPQLSVRTVYNDSVMRGIAKVREALRFYRASDMRDEEGRLLDSIRQIYRQIRDNSMDVVAQVCPDIVNALWDDVRRQAVARMDSWFIENLDRIVSDRMVSAAGSPSGSPFPDDTEIIVPFNGQKRHAYSERYQPA